MKEKVRDRDVIKTWCLSSVLNFTRYFFKERFHRKFIIGEHHRLIASALDGLEVVKPRSSIVSPVSPANKEACVLISSK